MGGRSPAHGEFKNVQNVQFILREANAAAKDFLAHNSEKLRK
ncbi:hypothetical protein PLANPX_4229 [Lacipirellula parvula]|uniref:Uncharacterized protein n=1 Tax=Lacipirellula parvula TaxID=2650471 RepID=A0A5K7XEZ0_9BACT|nr:hypothetical protein PLANPX_4229 [Lacipirellula parvula]